jgi:methylated-DNA-[protein]-cysteine S-methyltransferase
VARIGLLFVPAQTYICNMTALGFTLFETPIGVCGIAWGETGIVGLQPPGGSAAQARARFLRRFPGAEEAEPPAEAGRAIELIAQLLCGEPVDLSSITLDMRRVSPFERRVYDVARSIPPGATLTYGEIAARLGEKDAAREVGQALGKNPFPIVVPCHRVVAAGGKLGGFSAPGGAAAKRRLLAVEARHAPALPLFGAAPG